MYKILWFKQVHSAIEIKEKQVCSRIMKCNKYLSAFKRKCRTKSKSNSKEKTNRKNTYIVVENKKRKKM